MTELGRSAVVLHVVLQDTIRREPKFKCHRRGERFYAAHWRRTKQKLTGPGELCSTPTCRRFVSSARITEALTCLIGLCVYVMLGQPLDWTLAGALMLGACLSVAMATLTVKTFPESLLRGAIGIAACLLGGVALLQVF